MTSPSLFFGAIDDVAADRPEVRRTENEASHRVIVVRQFQSIESVEKKMSMAEVDESGAGEEAADESARERERVPTHLQSENDPLVSQLYSVNDELVGYTFRLLEQSVTLSDAIVEINQVERPQCIVSYRDSLENTGTD